MSVGILGKEPGFRRVRLSLPQTPRCAVPASLAAGHPCPMPRLGMARDADGSGCLQQEVAAKAYRDVFTRPDQQHSLRTSGELIVNCREMSS